MNNLVSIIINTYNRKNSLSRAIESAYRDKYENKEVIVVDDFSSQDLSEVIDKYKIKSNFKYIRNKKNMGLAYSRNIGCENSSGEYIAFLDDDDQWIDSTKLTRQVEFLNNDTEERLFLVATSIVKLYKDQKKIDHVIKKPNNIKKHILQRNGILYPSTVLLRKKHIELAGGFDLRFPRGIDSDLYRRLILKHNLNYEIMPETMVLYTELGSDSITLLTSRKKNVQAIAVNVLIISKYFVFFIKFPVSFYTRLRTVGILVFRLMKTAFVR